MSDTRIDLAIPGDWFGFRPGMTREQVYARLEELNLEETENRDDYLSTAVGDTELEMWFEKTGDQRLRQLATDASDVFWNGKSLSSLRLDDALLAMEPLRESPMWSLRDATDEPFTPATPAAAATVPPSAPTDEMLLEEATLWLRDRGIGLVLIEATTNAIVWRDARDLPTKYDGPVTPEQRQLSRRPDIEHLLHEARQARGKSAASKDSLAPVRVVFTLVCLGLLALVGRTGFHEMQRWNQARVLTGKFVAMERAPRKKFFDNGPDHLRQHLPDDPVRTREVCRIEYLDPAGNPRTAAIPAAEFYIAPHQPGDEVQLAYAEGDPPQVKGTFKARDSAFFECFPLAIAVGLFYGAGLLCIPFLAKFRSPSTGAPEQKPQGVDPDRPEMR